MGAINLLAALATIFAWVLALYQYVEGRRRRRTDSERLAVLAEQLRAAAEDAVVAAETIDHIVQRTKSDATSNELRALARAARWQVESLASQLRGEDAPPDLHLVGMIDSSDLAARTIPPRR
jgi:hypothetical protein